MRYTSVTVDVDIDNVLENMSKTEIEELVADLVKDGYGGKIVGELPAAHILEDSASRLNTIVWLRANGYTVEPTGVAQYVQ